MVGGLAFILNNKMCITVGDNQLMCRFNPELMEQLPERTGFLPMIMNGKEYKAIVMLNLSVTKAKNILDFG